MSMTRPLIVALAAALAPAALAQDLFQLSLTPTGAGGPAPITVGGSKLFSLTEGMLDQSGNFSSYGGVAFSASLRYAGVDNAMGFTVNAAGDSATLQFTALGSGATVFTFTGADLEDQITDFLGRGAAGELEKFMREMSKRSLVFIVDGNPSAATARASRYRYNQFGLMDDLRPRYTPVIREGEVIPGREIDHAPMDPGAGGGDIVHRFRRQPDRVRVTDLVDSGLSSIRVDVAAGVISTDVGDGNEIYVAVTNTFRFGDRVALVIGVPVTFHKIQSAEVYNAQAHVNVPITLIRRTKMDGWTWKFTPGLMLAGTGSIDFVAGGLLWGAGFTNVVGYNYGAWSFSYIAQFDFYDSIKLEYDQYEWDPGLTQQILTNGVRAAYQIDDLWAVYGGLAYVDFLDVAAVDNFISPAVGLWYRTEHGFVFNFGYEGDIGDGYEDHRGTIGLQWSF